MVGMITLVRPLPVFNAFAVGVTNPLRALTPDPKEAAFASGPAAITVDLGAPTLVDAVFVGFTRPVQMSVVTSLDGENYSPMPGANLRSDDVAPTLINPVYHAVSIAPEPVLARYVGFNGTFPANSPIGVLAVGKAFVPTWGHEWGAGRPIEDTGNAERLIGGGFGIEEGVRVGGYQWTFGDLTDAEVRQLYAFFRDRGTTRSFLLVEDPEHTAGLHERIHWCLASRLEAYERTAPGATRYNLAVRDWA